MGIWYPPMGMRESMVGGWEGCVERRGEVEPRGERPRSSEMAEGKAGHLECGTRFLYRMGMVWRSRKTHAIGFHKQTRFFGNGKLEIVCDGFVPDVASIRNTLVGDTECRDSDNV